jgi:geranylgeranyl diphosphate synthase type I
VSAAAVDALEARLPGYVALVSAELRDIVGTSSNPLYGWMRYHLGWEDAEGRPVEGSPGKLLRPAALLMATEALDGDPERAVPAAAAVELIHSFSLLHDDIEDRSELRRERATLWTFTGVPQAINTGDGMHVLARLAVLRLQDRGFSPDLVLAAALELDRACLRLVEGQHSDIAIEGRTEVSRAEYLATIAGKSAAMFAAPFAIGALLAGADPPTVDAFRAFGHHTGMAFQAADDLLGTWGDPALTGKAARDDLRARKMTLPVIAAIEAEGEEGEALRRDYARAHVDDEDLDLLAARIERLGGRDACAAYAAAEEAAAQAAIEHVALAPEWRATLQALSRRASNREW